MNKVNRVCWQQKAGHSTSLSFAMHFKIDAHSNEIPKELETGFSNSLSQGPFHLITLLSKEVKTATKIGLKHKLCF